MNRFWPDFCMDVGMSNKLQKILTNPNEVLRSAGFIKPSNGYISEEARRKARARRKKKKK